MKVHKNLFISMMKKSNVGFRFIAKELGLTVYELARMLAVDEEFDYAQSATLMAMFGAEEMLPVIDWEGINVRCPI